MDAFTVNPWRRWTLATQSGLLAVSLIALGGCASPPFSQDLRQQAKPVTFAQVSANPDSFKGTTVIWGGSVIETMNEPKGADIYVLALPLNANGHPKEDAQGVGRFIARTTGFIDPESLKKGRYITVAGQINGIETKPFQNTHYAYPVITVREQHIWPQYYYAPYPYYYGPYWGPPYWYGPWWGWGYYPVWRHGGYWYHRSGGHWGVGAHVGRMSSGGGFRGGGGGHR